MKLLLYIQIKAVHSVNYGHPAWMDRLGTDTLVFEADNHSEAAHLHQGKQFVKDATQVCLYFEVEEDQSPGSLTGLIEPLLRNVKRSKRVFLKGQNKPLMQMLKLTKTAYKEVHENLAVESAARQYFE